jgi:hypothetical protein
MKRSTLPNPSTGVDRTYMQGSRNFPRVSRLESMHSRNLIDSGVTPIESARRAPDKNDAF